MTVEYRGFQFLPMRLPRNRRRARFKYSEFI